MWLLMLPLFNIFWSFKVFPALAESLQLYFSSHRIADCGERASA